MKLLFIYGPPAAGKLTVAREVAKRTDFKLFHNHATIDMVADIFEDRKIQGEVVGKLRLEVFEAAAKAGIDLIFTYVYAKGEDDEYVERVVNTIENNGGEVCFVQLVPDVSELEKRVNTESRQAFTKIKNMGIIHDITARYDLYGVVPHGNNFSINNTNIPPDEAAERIMAHFKL